MKDFRALTRESPWERWVKRVLLGAFCGYLVIAGFSGFRALVQVYSVRIDAPRVVRPGESISTVVKSSGRNTGDVTIELRQDGRVDTLGTRGVPGNRYGIFDPRPQTAMLTAALTSEVLAGFEDGPAQIRSIARGRSQLLRVPPPKIATATVQIVK